MSEIPDSKWFTTYCNHCDFASGYRGMDSCSKCRGTGSLLVLIDDHQGKRYSNTKEGWKAMEADYFRMIKK